MKIGGAFGSYLKAEDIGTQQPVVAIDRVEMEKIGDETKPILYFVGKDKGFVLNRTNANMISDLLGTDETDDWYGKRVRLFVTKVEFQGRRVPAIRIKEAPAAAARPQPEPVAPEPEGEFQATDDDIPF